jgi:hypothetical protein
MTNPWQTALILFGLLGVAAAAFLWGNSALYVQLRQSLADVLAARGLFWPMEPVLPWYILTNYPEVNDMMTPLDGVVLLIYLLGVGSASAAVSSLFLAGATRACGAMSAGGAWSWPRFHHFAQGLIPLAACGVFLGLSSLTVTMLKVEGLTSSWVGPARAALLIGATLWSLWLGWSIAGTKTESRLRQSLATLSFAGAAAAGALIWASMFWRLV